MMRIVIPQPGLGRERPAAQMERDVRICTESTI